MTIYFTDDILEKVKAQRKKVLLIYWLVIVGIYLVESVIMMAWHLTLPYMSPTIDTIKWIHYPITVVFVFVSFIYLCIPFKRVNKFYKMCLNIKTGLRETYEGYFYEYDPMMCNKDGVDCKSLLFIEWNKYKKVNFERKVLVPYEMQYPVIPKQAKVRYITQGNVLVQFEILSTEDNDK